MTLEAPAVGVFTTDLALVVQSWDAWIAAATGIGEEEARGRALGELFPELDARGLTGRMRRVGESGEVAVLAPAFHEYLLPCPPRVRATHFARMQQLVTMAPLRDGDHIAGIMVTIEDVTARRDRERELARRLEQGDEGERLEAVRALAESDGTAPLVGALADPSWRVRQAAADGLAHERDDAAIDALVAAVRERHRDAGVLNAALAALVRSALDVLPALLPLLASPDSDVRIYAALALGLLEDRRAVPALIGALADADDNVRFHAVEALGRIGARDAAPAVATVAESRDFAVAFAALDTLARIGEPSVAPRLVPLLDDPLLQPAAIDALGALGSEEVVGRLALLLETRDAPAAAVARALASIDARLGGATRTAASLTHAAITPAGIGALVDALPRARDDEAPAIVRVLGWLDGDGVDAALVSALTRAPARSAAADVLSSRGPRVVPPLVALLAAGEKNAGGDDDDDHQTRLAAAATLGRLGAVSAVPALAALLDGPVDLAVVAAGALSHVGDPRALEPLLAQLDHPHAALRQVAVAALNSIGHPELAARLPSLLADASPRVREAAARVAGYAGDTALLDAMIALCDDEDESVQRTAVEQLSGYDDPRARAAIRAALERGSAGVRAAAARALAHSDAEDALALLTTACADRDPWVRYYAARSLARLGGGRAEAGDTLLALAQRDAVPPVRIAAVEGVASLGGRECVAALRPIADDPDPAVAAPALLALGAARGRDTRDTLIEAVAHGDRARRIAALAALARRAEPESIPALVAIARHGADRDERARAVAALGGIPDAAAVSALVALASEPRNGAVVVEVLSKLPEDRVSSLRAALDDDDVSVRCTVIEALGRMRHGTATALLADALHDAEPAVRTAATHALARHDLRATAG